MTDRKVLTDRSGDVAIVTLNSPAMLNAMDLRMLEELAEALRDAAANARAILLTGAGRAFCAGARLGAGGLVGSEEGPVDIGLSLETHINPLMLALRDLPIPLVSAVRGPAAGVGCSLALAADIIVASETAVFLQAFVNIGLVPDGGSTWLLSRAIGRVRALEMMLLGEKLPASRAFEWGLVTRLVADEALEETALELAARLARGPTRSIALIRRNAWRAADEGFAAMLASERDLQRDAGMTRDHAEGLAAFLAKRPPCFVGC